MPTARIEIENYNNCWHAEVELAGITARRTGLMAPTFPEIMKMIEDLYYRDRPEERPEDDEPELPLEHQPRQNGKKFKL